eukprot:g47248.t1
MHDSSLGWLFDRQLQDRWWSGSDGRVIVIIPRPDRRLVLQEAIVTCLGLKDKLQDGCDTIQQASLYPGNCDHDGSNLNCD